MSDVEHGAGEVILIVDDDKNTRYFLRMGLKLAGYAVEEAENGADALKKYALCHPSAVLLDALMPGINGFEVCAHLQKLPKEKRVPVIMITALDDQESINRAFEAGAVDYVPKPVHWPVLCRRLQVLLQARRTEKVLETKNHLLQTVIDNLPDYIFAKDTEGRFLLSNLAHTQAMQVSTPEELIGKTALDGFPPELAAQFQVDDQFVIQSGQSLINIERTTVDSQGQIRQVLTTKVPLRNEEHKLLGLVGISRDITERKEVEKRLRESEAQYRRLVEMAQEGICTIDATNIITFINKRMTDMLGYTVDEMVGVALFSFMDEVSQAILTAHLEQRRQGISEQFDFRFRHRDGTDLWVIVSATPIWDDNGQYVGSFATLTDITGRKRAEKTLKESEIAEHEQRILAEALRDTATALATLDSQAVMTRILETVGRVVPHDTANILLIEGNEVRPVCWRGYPAEHNATFKDLRFPLDTPNLRDMIITRAPYLITDTALYPGWVKLPETAWVCSYVGVPIQVRGQVIGFLNLDSAQSGFFTAIHAERLRIFADQAALSVENAQLYDELSRRASYLEARVNERTAQLQQAKENVEAILNNSSDAIAVTGSDGLIHQVNPAFNDLFGYQVDEIFGQSPLILVEANSVRVLKETLRLVTENGCSQRIEITMLRKKGSAFSADIALSQITQPGGLPAAVNLSSIIFSIRDITERKQMEEALKKNEEQLRRITDSMMDLIIQIDSNGVIQYASPSCWNVLGYEMEHLCGQKFSLWLHPDDAPQITTQIWEVDRLECRFQHARGDYIWLEIVGNLLFTANTLSGALLSGRDVTARKQAETELRVSESRYHSVVSVLTEGILMYNSDGRCTEHNASAERLLGLTAAEMPELSLLAPHWRAIHEDGSRFTAEEHPVTITLHTAQAQANIIMGLTRPDGSLIWVSINSQPLINGVPDHPYAVVVSLVDVTERIHMELGLRDALAKQKELTDLKSRFVSMASHEFRTPLATIQSTIDNLRYFADRMTDEQKTGRLTKIQTQIQHMTILLEDVLTLGRFDAGAIEFKPELLDLDGLLQDIVEEFKQTWAKHLLDYTQPNEIGQVSIDKKLLRQIILNLLTNAGKYSDQGSTVHLSLDYMNGSIAVRVRDEGIGIPEQDLKYLFEPFHRASNVGTIPGTGLGLSIVKRAIELYGGSITVESTVGAGTTFTVVMPVNKEVMAAPPGE